MSDEREALSLLSEDPVPVASLPEVYELLTRLGLLVARGYRCVVYAWEEGESGPVWHPKAAACLGEGMDPGHAAKSLIAKAGASGEAGLYRFETSPTRSMVKYAIDAVAVFPFRISTCQGEKRFVLYLDVLSGATLDSERVRQLGRVLQSLLSLAGGAIGALLEVEADRAERQREDRPFRGDFSEIVGRSEALRKVLALVDRIAPTDFPVLILGETGTGKELIARALHRNGREPDGPFEAINCAMLPEQLAESMLFGHVKGAFTDARSDHRGVFELADGGTLFLDEVGELRPDHQAKLLRVLDSGKLRRVGSESLRSIDVRVVSATNRDLRTLVDKGHFRADLYHRLSAVSLTLPPLRDRREDIPELVRHFLDGRPKRIRPEVIARLTAATWEGNIRELKDKVKVLCELALGEEVELGDLDYLHLAAGPTPGDWPQAWKDTERDFLVRLIAESPTATVEDTARLLGKSRSWLYDKAKEHGIKLNELLKAKSEAREAS